MKYPLAFVLEQIWLCSFAAHGGTEYASKQQTEVTTAEYNLKKYADFIWEN